MKKLSILCGIVMIIGLMSGPVLADSFIFDVTGDGNSDTAWSLDPTASETVAMDIYFADYTPTTDMFGCGFFLHYDNSKVQVNLGNSAIDNSCWDSSFNTLADLGSGVISISVANMSCCPVTGGKIKIATIELECIASDFVGSTISTTFTGSPTGSATDCDDGDITTTQASATILQIPPPCGCSIAPSSSDLAPAGTVTLNVSQVNPSECSTSSYEWTTDCTQLTTVDLSSCDGNASCLVTAGDIAVYETCKVYVDDLANTFPSLVECEADLELIPVAGCASKIYRGGVCEESSPLDTIYNRPGRRGLSITCCEEEEFCICSSCDEREHCWFVTKVAGDASFDPAVDLVADSGTGDQFTLKVADPCTTHCPMEPVILKVSIEDCAVPGTELDSVEVQIGRVALGVGDTNAHPGTETADVEVLLWNYENHVRAIQADICGTQMDDCMAYGGDTDACRDVICAQETDDVLCDADPNCQWKMVGGVDQCVNAFDCVYVTGLGCVAEDNLVCTECIVDEDRSTEFICSANEQANGCCRVTLYTTEPDDLIQQGDGAVAIVKYDVGEELTTKDCIELVPADIKISDQFNEFLCAVPKTGEICFLICGDVYPQDCYQCQSCGDGVVDLFDILEEIDIVLGLQTASLCQMLHGDVPLGMPPYCGNPAGVNPPNCETDGIIDIFDALVIIDKALSRMNCCDYCLYGSIY